MLKALSRPSHEAFFAEQFYEHSCKGLWAMRPMSGSPEALNREEYRIPYPATPLAPTIA
jgi:hypothetical protein